jgi:hypothetical protein
MDLFVVIDCVVALILLMIVAGLFMGASLGHEWYRQYRHAHFTHGVSKGRIPDVARL